MRKLLAISIFCFIAVTSLRAQNYGNSWINFSQQYFKIAIPKEGIYRIDSTTLATHYNLASIDPRNFQLFIKGKEQHLFIMGEGDSKININDYLEFYANPFVGDVDSLLYFNINYNPSPYIPLFHDTLYAFLTVNNLITNKRYQLETDTTASLYETADHFYSDAEYHVKYNYNSVKEYQSDASDPRYTQAEGFGFPILKGGAPAVSNFSNLGIVTSSALPSYFTISYSGASVSNLSSLDHEVHLFYTDQTSSQVLLKDTVFRGFLPVKRTYTISSANTSQNTNFSLYSIASPTLSGIGNTTSMHYMYYMYPHMLDLGNKSSFRLFITDATTSSKKFFNFSNFNFASSSNVLMYDLTNNKKITTKIASPMLRAVVPNGSGNKFCYLSAESQVIPVTSLFRVNNNTGSFTNFKTSPANKPFVIIYNNLIKPGAQDYINYRQSIAGGGYNVISADVGSLYEQFSFGLKNHPLAIRNFIKYLKDSLANPPQYVFLIGKAIRCEEAVPGYTQNLVPTMGIPSCDNLLATGLSSASASQLFPEIPIGRIAAVTNSDVTTYLNKIQQHESSAPADWKKKVLHFVGGDEPTLTNLLSSYMSQYEQVVEDTLFGGYVLTFKKNTTAPIQINISDSIKNTISNGAALINFFGHGSEQGFDQAIDDPEVYNNAGKYPFVIANSCYSGNIHKSNFKSVSEDFVFSNQKGSIGFLAASSLGFVYALNNYTSRFYQALSRTKYNQGVGDMVKETTSLCSLLFDSISKFTALDMTLHGDPSVKISNGALPDYRIQNSSVVFDTKTYSDSIGVKIHIKNLGSSPLDSFAVRIERHFPNGDSSIVLKKILAPSFKDSLNFYMLTDFNRGIGLNKFDVTIDYFNEITESLENNNSTLGGVNLFIQGGDLIPVYPYKYAVVPKTGTITLKASTTDPFAPLSSYRLELDTCDKFINPIQTTLITSKGGVIEWNVNLPFADSTVYFWRVSRDSVSPSTPFAWRESSFQTIGTKRGWGQAHFHQFKNDVYQFVTYKKPLRKFVFEDSKYAIRCRDGIEPFIDFSDINWFFNNIKMADWGCAAGGWNFMVFDSISGQPDAVVSVNYPSAGLGTYNNCVCVDNQVLRYYSYGIYTGCAAQVDYRGDMTYFLNSVAKNNYVLGYTIGTNQGGGLFTQMKTYNKATQKAFESVGVANVENLTDSVAHIFFGRKGMLPGQAKFISGINKKSVITLDDTIKTKWHNGYIASELIGPSFKWNSLHWKVQSLDATNGDTTVLKVVGYKNNGQIDTLTIFPQDSMDVLDLGNYVDASIYPHIKLVAFMKDDIFTTSPQLKRWQVLYDEAPECAINPLKGFASVNDTLQEGDHVTYVFPIENIGIKNFDDSLVVTYWIEDNSRNIFPLSSKLKAKPFVPGQVLMDTVKVNTYQFAGNNLLWVYVNPYGNAKYQREHQQFNNIARYPFKVSKDVTNPLLDVTFDGIRILNGDIVSAKPNIVISLKDENQFLALNDTGAFSVFLQPPNSSAQQKLYFGKDLEFIPANLPKNSCMINYSPVLPVDGKYTLIVQAKDRSNNRSGVTNYQIQFEINNKPTITSILNYPNPFSTSTRFVFTLTGSEVPEVFTIQIITISGKVVREITRAELGNVHIGRNITEYAWDGKDEYGDKLGNGVYLYKVVTKLNGQNVEKSATGADKFFVKEFGKLVIMR
ncbi:MAG: hypothetical protein K0S32_1302 [Bacteroidetes bacterium]|nr:hypothetical protein [Bacteroidota bacterium]